MGRIARLMDREVAWRGETFPGVELCRLSVEEGRGTLGGSVAYEDGGGGLLSYHIRFVPRWQTVDVVIRRLPRVGPALTRLVVRDERGRWTVDGADRADLADCDDVDLEFSPSTNTLPIRRLDLPVGASAPVAAAWVRFPALTVEVIRQTYERTGERDYRYRSGSFTADLAVDDAGLVIDYPGIWRRAGRE